MRAFNSTKRRILGTRVREAKTLLERMRGLLGTRGLEGGEGLWIAPCASVHSFGMGYPIDVVFLDAGGTVVGLVPSLSPNRITRWFPRASGALELPAGTIGETETEPGDRVEFREEEDAAATAGGFPGEAP
jgi:uncharacterized protein